MKKQSQTLLTVPNFFDLADESTGFLNIADIAANYRGVDEEALFTGTLASNAVTQPGDALNNSVNLEVQPVVKTKSKRKKI